MLYILTINIKNINKKNVEINTFPLYNKEASESFIRQKEIKNDKIQ